MTEIRRLLLELAENRLRIARIDGRPLDFDHLATIRAVRNRKRCTITRRSFGIPMARRDRMHEHAVAPGTSLAALKGFVVQTARRHEPELEEWQLETLAGIDQASERVVELVDDLLAEQDWASTSAAN